MLTNDETDCGEWRRVYAYAVNGGSSIVIVIIFVIFIVVCVLIIESMIDFYHQIGCGRIHYHR